MKRNRLILAAVILAAGIYASFFGGNFSYTLFYLTLIVPVLSLMYTLFVYLRFRLYQDIGERKVLKGELVPYAFTLSNEDAVSYTNIKVNFFKDKSYVSDTDGRTEYLLLPGQSDTLQTTLCCKYRGEYDVGVKSVEITDFLYLFSVTYPIYTKLNLTVLPRVFTLDKLVFSQDEQDPKKSRYRPRPEEEFLDVDVRKYAPGDSMRTIHWKVSARQNALFTRRVSDHPKTKVLLLLDLSPVHEKDLSKVIVEDQMLESALSIADYYKNHSTDVDVCYDQNGRQAETIDSETAFKAFYQRCATLHFNGRTSAAELLLEQIKTGTGRFFGILIVHSVTGELYDVAAEAVARGNSLALLFVSDDVSEPVKLLLQDFGRLGIAAYRITGEDNVTDRLSR